MTVAFGSNNEPRNAVITLRGELDIATVAMIEARMGRMIPPDVITVTIDLSDVTFMDSSGIALLLRTSSRVPSLTLRQPSAPVALVLEATGLTNTLQIEQ
jgi:anti-anti-sigma factor